MQDVEFFNQFPTVVSLISELPFESREMELKDKQGNQCAP